MVTRRINATRLKRHRSYDASELAALLGVHKNTVRQWTRDGLKPLGDGRPALFHGDDARAFLVQRNASRKRPCPPGTLYCFRCREARKPAGAMADYQPVNTLSGNLKAMCAECETIMHRRVRLAMLVTIMPALDVRIMEAPAHLIVKPCPSLNRDSATETLP